MRSKMRAANWESVENLIRTEFPEVCSVSTCELADWLDDEVRQDPVVLDVRSVAEYSISHLRNASHATTVDQAIAIIEQSRERNGIVLYCSVGYRSAKLASQLLAEGVERVYNLRGSIFQWANERRPICRGNELVTEVHPYNKKWGQLLTAGNDS